MRVEAKKILTNSYGGVKMNENLLEKNGKMIEIGHEEYEPCVFCGKTGRLELLGKMICEDCEDALIDIYREVLSEPPF